MSDANVEAVSIRAGGERVNIPHHCEGCKEMWRPEDESLGARYLIDARWLCVACMLLLNGCGVKAIGVWYQTEDGGGLAHSIYFSELDPAATLPRDEDEFLRWVREATSTLK
jgi:hypothetical protein